MKRLLLLLSVCLLLCCGAVAQGETILVSPDGLSLTEALEKAVDGDEIVLAGGVYDDETEAFPIMIDKPVALRAKDGETPVISSPIQVAALQIRAPGVRMEGITISFHYSGMWLMADDATITGCVFALADEQWRTSSCGIWVGGAKRMTLTNNVFDGCGIAMAGPRISESSAGLPVLTGMFEVGEDIEYFTTHTVENNTVNGRPLQYVLGLQDAVFAEEAGQVIAVQCKGVRFENMDVSRASIGFETAYCEDIVVRNVVADDCGIFGIYISKTTDGVITGCRADRGAHGIDVRAAERCVVVDCSTTGCGQGVFFSFAFNSAVRNCDIIDNGTGFFSASGDNNHMDGCLVQGNQLGMYVQHEPSFLMTNSTFADNWNTGARVTHGGFVCVDNTFDSNWVAAMTIDCGPVTYAHNIFTGSGNRDIYAQESRAMKLLGNVYEGDEAPRNELVDCSDVFSVEDE